jgi:hypothetical protein
MAAVAARWIARSAFRVTAGCLEIPVTHAVARRVAFEVAEEGLEPPTRGL